ncbi:MAG TPA: hypothetical protein DDZ51_29150, partial [Planctomycetaceae bacterium]|nr:hypothetical protein [Planctomycetaceae bacterium]
MSNALAIPKKSRRLKSSNPFVCIGIVVLALHWLLLEVPNASARQVELHTAVQSGAVAVRIEFLGGAMGDRMKV